MMEAGMDLCNELSIWQAPDLAQPMTEPSWEEMLNTFLQPEDSGAVEEAVKSIESSDCRPYHEIGHISGGEYGVSDELLWSGGVSDVLPDFCESLLLENDGNLPGLSSENSSLVDEDSRGPDGRSPDGEVLEATNSIDAAPQSPVVSKSSSGDASAFRSPIADTPPEVKVYSPDTGCDSSDVGASGKSCDNFTDQSERQSEKASDLVDEDTKRESRLKRNRESASQSRMRKKSYVKDMEAKCRAMESQLGMLHQTVAFFSSQNAALREELALVKSSKGHGSKSGAMEPAALPSDSLPSESPSRRTTCLMVQWELVVFLFHVSLLMLFLPALLPSRVARGESSQNEEQEAAFRHSDEVVTRSVYRPSLPPERVWERNGVCRDFLRPFDRPFSIADLQGTRTVAILA